MIYSLFANRYFVGLAALICAVIGLKVALATHDHTVRTVQEAKDNAQYAALVLQRQQDEAAQWKASYNASQEEISNVHAQRQVSDSKASELQRRADALRMQNYIPNSPAHGNETAADPPGTAGSTTRPGILVGSLAEALTGCATDYANVASELAAIKRLRDRADQ